MATPARALWQLVELYHALTSSLLRLTGPTRTPAYGGSGGATSPAGPLRWAQSAPAIAGRHVDAQAIPYPNPMGVPKPGR